MTAGDTTNQRAESWLVSIFKGETEDTIKRGRICRFYSDDIERKPLTLCAAPYAYEATAGKSTEKPV